jgi:hypothetical protein
MTGQREGPFDTRGLAVHGKSAGQRTISQPEAYLVPAFTRQSLHIMKHLCSCGFFLLMRFSSFANDPCQAPLHWPQNTCNYITYSASGATGSNVSAAPCSALNSKNDVWVKSVVPACAPVMVLSVQGGPAASQLPTGILYVYRGQCNGLLTATHCNWFDSTSGYFISDTLRNMLAGDTLFIRVLDYWNNGGQFGLCVSGFCPTDIEKVSSTPFSISPNPATATVSISALVPFSQAPFELRDITGRLIAAWKGGEPGSIDVSAFTDGVYFVRMLSGTATATRKLVISR